VQPPLGFWYVDAFSCCSSSNILAKHCIGASVFGHEI
jgi:hypothetical protein